MKTSWQTVHKWYNENVGAEGHYYHQHVILPHLLPKLDSQDLRLLDLACGQGVLGRKIKGFYTGYDISPSLIKSAKSQDKQAGHSYHVQDITKPIITPDLFNEAVILLALQNIDKMGAVFLNAQKLLVPGGRLHIVLNHPCFRIPRQSSWGDDKEKKIQYRRIDRYMTPLEIPIHANPGQGEKSAQTISFHHPLSTYIAELAKVGFVITGMEEWISDKESTGKNSRQENRARNEIPLFLYLQAKKT